MNPHQTRDLRWRVALPVTLFCPLTDKSVLYHLPSTVDGREIRPEHLRDAAANYSPDLYGACVNVEHYLSPFPGSDVGAMGDVKVLSAEYISEGPLAGRTALYAEIEPSKRMKKLTDEGKKIYSGRYCQF